MPNPKKNSNKLFTTSKRFASVSQLIKEDRASKTKIPFRSPGILISNFDNKSSQENSFAKVKLNDKRKIRGTTGLPLDPNRDKLDSSYNANLLSDVVRGAKKNMLDPYTMVAIAIAETNLGKTDSNIGHTLKNKDQTSAFNKNYDPVQNMMSAYKRQQKLAKGNTEADKIQAYNGYGIVTPKTEANYHGFDMQSIYGVPIPKEGINMKTNPLYGKNIIDIRDNILKNSPEIKNLIDTTKVREVPYKYTEGGAKEPYYTNDPNDPRIQAYRDSSDKFMNSYNELQKVKKQVKQNIGAFSYRADKYLTDSEKVAIKTAQATKQRYDYKPQYSEQYYKSSELDKDLGTGSKKDEAKMLGKSFLRDNSYRIALDRRKTDKENQTLQNYNLPVGYMAVGDQRYQNTLDISAEDIDKYGHELINPDIRKQLEHNQPGLDLNNLLKDRAKVYYNKEDYHTYKNKYYDTPFKGHSLIAMYQAPKQQVILNKPQSKQDSKVIGQTWSEKVDVPKKKVSRPLEVLPTERIKVTNTPQVTPQAQTQINTGSSTPVTLGMSSPDSSTGKRLYRLGDKNISEQEFNKYKTLGKYKIVEYKDGGSKDGGSSNPLTQLPQGYFLNIGQYNKTPQDFGVYTPNKTYQPGQNAAPGTTEPMVGLDDPIFNILTMGSPKAILGSSEAAAKMLPKLNIAENAVAKTSKIQNILNTSKKLFNKKTLNNAKTYLKGQNPVPNIFENGAEYIKNWHKSPEVLERLKKYENENLDLDFDRVLQNKFPTLDDFDYNVNKSERDLISDKLNNFQDKSYRNLLKDNFDGFLENYKTSSGISYGQPDKIYSKRLSLRNILNPYQREHTVAHELSHLSDKNGKYLGRAERRDLLEPFGLTEESRKEAISKMTNEKEKANFEYFTDPTEIRARINQGRFYYNHDPKNKFTQEMVDNLLNSEHNFFGMGKYIKDPKIMKDIMNKMWQAAPAAGVLGASELNKKQKFGGKINSTWSIIK